MRRIVDATPDNRCLIGIRPAYRADIHTVYGAAPGGGLRSTRRSSGVSHAAGSSTWRRSCSSSRATSPTVSTPEPKRRDEPFELRSASDVVGPGARRGSRRQPCFTAVPGCRMYAPSALRCPCPAVIHTYRRFRGFANSVAWFVESGGFLMCSTPPTAGSAFGARPGIARNLVPPGGVAGRHGDSRRP